jgi:hypothetical protein
MILTFNDIGDALNLDLGIARQRLVEAQVRQKDRDSAQNRAAVAESWMRIDTILDLLLEVKSASLM